jgi:Fusaric acid resistance protein-like
MLSFLRSSYALFGLRAALAGFAASLPAFLQSSATFYGAYRGVWSTIVIVISLGPTTGASLNGLLSQCLGTIFGGLVSMAVWYMVDQKVAGVIVLSFVVTLFRLNYIEGQANNRLVRLPSGPPPGLSKYSVY